MTKAQDILFSAGLGLEIQAFEFAYDNTVNVTYHEGFEELRFDDESSVRVTVSDDHEITFFEA